MIRITEDAEGITVDTGLLEGRAARILEALDEAQSELSLSLVSDEAIRELNAKFRGMDRPTDVLSFSLLEGEAAQFRGNLLGDVVISMETAARQAEELGATLDEELARLLIHGVLHLLGHDHVEEEETRRMRAEEERLWQLVMGGAE